MAGLFSKGQNTVTEAERVSEFQVNQATYGNVVPIIFGTTRIAGNIIDYFNFTAIQHSETTRTGKGGGGTSSTNITYTYKSAVLIGLCEGQITSVGRVWQGADTITTLAGLGFTLFNGALGQAAWSYAQSVLPAHALPYSGLAYVAGYIDLNSSGGMYTYNFEVAGVLQSGGDGVDCNPADICNYIMTNAVNGIGITGINAAALANFQTFADAADLLGSLPLTDQSKAYEIVNNLCEACDVMVFDSQGELKFVPRCEETIGAYVPDLTVQYDIDEDDFLPFDNGVLVQFSRTSQAATYNQATVEYINRANGYESETVDKQVLADVSTRGLRPASTKSYHFFHTKARAEQVAMRLALKSCYDRLTYTFRLAWNFCRLEPGDIVTLSLSTGPLLLNRVPVRIETVEEDDEGELEITAKPLLSGVATPARYTVFDSDRASRDYQVDPGDANAPAIFELPAVLSDGVAKTFIATAGGANWGGANVWVSDDGSTYRQVGSVAGKSRHGVLAAILPTSATTTDTTNILSVDLSISGGELTSGTQEDAQNMRTLCWVDGELIAYATATLTGANRYNLSYLIRGCYGTPITSHAAGAKFVRVDDLFGYGYSIDDIGKTIYTKLQAFNIYGSAAQDLSEVAAYSHQITGIVPPNASNITIDEDTFLLKDGTALSDILVRFTAPTYNGSLRYLAYLEKNNDGNWVLVGEADPAGYKIKSLQNTTSVRVKIITVSADGKSTGLTSSSYTITGKSAPPSDVSGFTATQRTTDRSIIDMRWTGITDIDLNCYEIRYGELWEAGTVVAKQIGATTYQFTAQQSAYYRFMICALDNSGNYSASPAVIGLQVTLTPDAPANLAASQLETDLSVLGITFDRVTGGDIAGYEIRTGATWASSTLVAFVTNNKYEWRLEASGTYPLLVKSKTVAGYYSVNAATASAAATIEPLGVNGFTATQSINDRTKVTLYWDAPTQKAISHYIIKKGTAWETATVVGNRVTGVFAEVSVAEETAQTFLIKAVSVDGKESQYPAQVTDIYSLNPSPVSNIVLSQSATDKSVLEITWDGIMESDLAYYDIRLGYVWESATQIGKTKEMKWTHQLLGTGSVKIMIKSISAAGYASDEVSATYYAVMEPLSVTGFVAYQNGETVQLYWDKASEFDVAAYELREGATFAQGALVATGITLNQFLVNVDSERLYRYHIKAINRAGYYSAEESSVSVVVATLPVRNVIASYDEIASPTGTHSNTEFGESLINFSNMGGRFSDYPTTRFSDVGGATVLKLKNANLISDGNFSSGVIGAEWIAYAGGTRALNNGVLRHTATSATTTGVYYDFPQTLDRNAVYVVEWEARANRALSGSVGFTTQAGSYSALCGARTNLSLSLTTAWQIIKKEFTISATGTEPGRFLFNYMTVVAGDWTEIKWARIYKKTDEGLFLVNQWGGGYYSSGVYSTAVLDLGAIVTANISVDFVSTVLLKGAGSAALQMRTSQDGVNYTDWVEFKPVQYTFRYAQFRVLLATTDPAKTPEVNQITINVDVPDTEIRKTVTVAAGGSTITYGHDYYAQVVLTPTAIGEGLRAELISKTLSSCVLKVKNSSNTDVGGQVDLRGRGY